MYGIGYRRISPYHKAYLFLFLFPKYFSLVVLDVLGEIIFRPITYFAGVISKITCAFNGIIPIQLKAITV